MSTFWPKEDLRAYGSAVLKHWWIIAITVFATVVEFAQNVIQSWYTSFVMPIWVWLSIVFVGLSVAQFLAWRDMRQERDILRRYDVAQQILSELADQRDGLISHQNIRPSSGTDLGAWIEQYKNIRNGIRDILSSRVSHAESRAFDHIGLFSEYAAPLIKSLSNNEMAKYLHWRSRIARDHKWLEQFVLDYGRYRYRADLSAIH